MAPAEAAPYSPAMSGRSRRGRSRRGRSKGWLEPGARAEAERFAASNLFSFLLWLRLARGRTLADKAALAAWAAEDPDGFADAFWDFARVIGEKARALSFAENVLRHRGGRAAVAGRGGALSRDGLRDKAASFAAALRAAGIGPGDAVGGWVPDDPEGVAAFLGANALGAVWASEADEAQFRLEQGDVAELAAAHRGAALGFVRRPLAAPLAILGGGVVARQEAFLGNLRDILLRAEVRPDQRVVPEPAVGWLWGVTVLATGARLDFGLRAKAPPGRAPQRRSAARPG